MKLKICIPILLLALLRPVLSAECPPPEDIGHCSCRVSGSQLNVFCAYGDTEPSLDDLKMALHVFDKGTSVSLTLSFLELGTLASDFFAGLNIRQLFLEHCKLDSLAPEGELPLSGLEDTLEVLLIFASFKENQIPAKVKVSDLRNLKTLYLRSNVISELSDDWFANGPTQLSGITLLSNGIKKLGPNVFGNLTNLVSLTVEGNEFDTIQRSMLPSSASKLKTLRLHNNRLTSIPQDLFTEMPALKTLDLSDNGIHRIEKEAFQTIWRQAETISLTFNPLECDSSTLKWMKSSLTRARIYGTCASPPKRRGKTLDELIQEDSE